MSNWWDADPVASQPKQIPAVERGQTTPLRINVGAQAPQGQSAGNWWDADPVAPQTNSFARMNIEHQNIGPSATQGAVSSFADYKPENLLSTDIYESDVGPLQFKNNQGQIEQADTSKHIIIRNPNTGQLNVFARTPETTESGLAGKLGGVAQIIGSGLSTGPSPARVGAARAAIPTTAETFNAADTAYKAARAVPATFDPAIGSALADHITTSLNQAGAFPHLTKKVHQTVDLLRQGGSINELRSVQEALNGLKIHKSPRVRQAAGEASQQIIDFLKRTEPVAGNAIETANANFAAASRAQQIEGLKEVAGLRTGRAGYGGNAVNNFRQVLSPIVEKAIKGNRHGFSPEEIRAMHEIVHGTTSTNILRGIGQLSPSKGAIQSGLALGTGGLTALIGAVANRLATRITSGQIDRLGELIRKRSPAYQDAVRNAFNNYNGAAEAFVTNPSDASLLKFIIASRNLSNGLTRDGIKITSGDLMRAIQGPVKGAAEDEQPKP